MSSTEQQPTWAVPQLSTLEAGAVEAYRQGVAALVAGAPDAEDLLRECIERDPMFVLGQVAMATAEALTGVPFQVSVSPSTLTRGERQHAEIVNVTFAGDTIRAADLRREHLVDFPGDLLIVWLPVVVTQRQRSC